MITIRPELESGRVMIHPSDHRAPDDASRRRADVPRHWFACASSEDAAGADQ